MESNTETKEVKKNGESGNVVEDFGTDVEIEDCSDNSENVVVEFPTKSNIQNTEAEIKSLDIEKQDETEVNKVIDGKNTEEYSHSLSCNDLVETVANRPEIVVEDDNENISASPTTASKAPVVTEQQNVAEYTSEGNKENEIVNEEIKEEGEIGCATEEDKPVLSEDNIVENKQVKLSENAKTAIALLSVKPKNSRDQVDTFQPGRLHQLQGENWNNNIKDIISDIDLNIEQENCDLLKQQQKDLLQRQQELVQQIRQQQLIAQQLATANRLHQQQFQKQQQQLESPQQLETQKITSTLKQKPTPTPSQLQKNISKYSKVEETKDEYGYTQNAENYEYKESTNASKRIDLLKIFTPAVDIEEIIPRNRKLYSSSAFYSPALHPTVEDQVELARRISHSLSDISNQKSKGQSMYVNRKKRSLKWVHEGAGQDYHQQQQQLKPATSSSILPAYSDAGKHRLQLNLHQEQVLEKYVKPGLKVVKTPWEAALETGSASTAFIDDVRRTQHTSTQTLSPAQEYKYGDPNTADAEAYKNGFTADYTITPFHEQPQAYFPTIKPNFGHNSRRELAYKPSLPKGWKAPSPSLPKELYLPKEISLESYAPPPVVMIKDPESIKPSWKFAPTTLPRTSTSPLVKPNHGGFRTYCQPKSCRPVQQETSQLVPQINYNPSPLPYDKIAKFENTGEQQTQNNECNPQTRRLAIKSNVGKVQNILPTSLTEKPTCVERLSTSPYHYNSPKTDINYMGTPTPVYSKRINPNALLHGQNYNNTARGWKSSDISFYKSPFHDSLKSFTVETCGIYQQVPLRATSSLPYTDF